MCSSSWPPTLRGIWRMLLISSRISMFATWICQKRSRRPYYRPSTLSVRLFTNAAIFYRITVHTSFGLFILGYFINMDNDHIASDKESIYLWKKCAMFRYSRVGFTRKRTFHLVIWSVNGSHFVNYSMIFVVSHIGVVYKSNYNLKTNR